MYVMYQLNYERMLCHMVLECAAGVWCVLVRGMDDSRTEAGRTLHTLKN